jgi:NifU-like protein
MHCSVMGAEALRAAIANYRGEEWVDDHDEGQLICKCFGVDAPMIERAVEVNGLTTLEEFTNYTKAGGSCKTCHEAIEDVLEAVLAKQGKKLEPVAGAASPAPAVIGLDQIAPLAAPVAAKPAAPAKKLSNVQRMQIVIAALDEMRPYLKADGGDVELVDIDGKNIYVRLSGACSGCQMASVTIEGIQTKLVEKLGELVRVIPHTMMAAE